MTSRPRRTASSPGPTARCPPSWTRPARRPGVTPPTRSRHRTSKPRRMSAAPSDPGTGSAFGRLTRHAGGNVMWPPGTDWAPAGGSAVAPATRPHAVTQPPLGRAGSERGMGWLEWLSQKATDFVGNSWGAAAALALMAAWLVAGPALGLGGLFEYAGQVVAGVTFVLLFLLQRSQTKDTLAIQ